MVVSLVIGLPEMEVIALLGLLGIASVSAWTSASLWQRQRAVERELDALYDAVHALQGETPAERPWDEVPPTGARATVTGSLPSLWGWEEHEPEPFPSSRYAAEAAAVAEQLRQSSPAALRQLLQGSLDLSRPGLGVGPDRVGEDGRAGGWSWPEAMER